MRFDATGSLGSLKFSLLSDSPGKFEKKVARAVMEPHGRFSVGWSRDSIGKAGIIIMDCDPKSNLGNRMPVVTTARRRGRRYAGIASPFFACERTSR